MIQNQMIQFRELINALLTRTREGKIEWAWDEQTASGIATLASGRVIVSKDSDFDTFVKIQNPHRKTIEEVNVGYPRYKGLKVPVDELYDLARRSALGVDSTLESILREIST